MRQSMHGYRDEPSRSIANQTGDRRQIKAGDRGEGFLGEYLRSE